MLAPFGSQKQRLAILASYAQGDNFSILSGHRRLDDEKADYRVRHKWVVIFPALRQATSLEIL